MKYNPKPKQEKKTKKRLPEKLLKQIKGGHTVPGEPHVNEPEEEPPI